MPSIRIDVGGAFEEPTNSHLVGEAGSKKKKKKIITIGQKYFSSYRYEEGSMLTEGENLDLLRMENRKVQSLGKFAEEVGIWRFHQPVSQ